MDLRPVLLAGAAFASAALTFAQSLPPAPAEPTEEELLQDLRALDELAVAKNQLSFSLRFGGKLKARFQNVGTITSALDLGDTTTEAHRTYNDGYVSLDARVDGDGNDVASDGRTNTWSYNSATQVSADGTAIDFHRYETRSEGASILATSNPSVGIDIEGSRELWRFGRSLGPGRRVFTVGAGFGFGLNTLNAKSSASITATLLTITDSYSLLGAPPPGGDPSDSSSTGYSAPSTTTVTVTNADGTTTTQTIDNTTYLGSTPQSRTETATPGGATIKGMWQVKGAYFSVRGGPWLRWQPSDRFSLRFSVGASANVVGLRMRYDEQLDLEDLDLTTAVQNADESTAETSAQAGFFGGVDAEYWLSERTGFFGSASYEYSTRDSTLTLGGRSALIKMSAGLGLRSGLSFKF
ncbi:MAG: hypothetical protein HYV96_09105 [Opitutae bacterium]|nr:hypothetical protein [Opitutae bacterium]